MPKTRTKSKSTVRRPPPRSRRELPLLPLAVGGVFLLIFVVLAVLYALNRSSGPASGQPVANIQCETGEQLAVHYHAHLEIIYKGQPATIPGQIGIPSQCIYWVHTHDTSGVIHIEAPKSAASRAFTLGDFFKVWNQPLSKAQVATFKVDSGLQMKIWVNGQPYSGDPAGIPLKSHDQVVIEIGPPFTEPPPNFVWDPNQYAQ